ncbi:MAG: DUF167 domain-containing protein [Vicinamibacterales bacterium]
MIHQSPTGVEVDIRVVPRAGRSGLAGERDGRLLVRLSAPPVDGAANAALIDFLSSLFDRPKRSVRILSGDKSRSKRVAIDGVSLDVARRLLAGPAAG